MMRKFAIGSCNRCLVFKHTLSIFYKMLNSVLGGLVPSVDPTYTVKKKRSILI